MSEQLLAQDERTIDAAEGVENDLEIAAMVEEVADYSQLSVPKTFRRSDVDVDTVVQEVAAVAKDMNLTTTPERKLDPNTDQVPKADEVKVVSTEQDAGPRLQQGVEVKEGSGFWGVCMQAAGIIGNGIGRVAGVLGRPLMPDESRSEESSTTHFIKRGLLGIDPNGLDETAAVWLRRGFVAAGAGFAIAGAPLVVGAFWSAQALGLLNLMYYKG